MGQKTVAQTTQKHTEQTHPPLDLQEGAAFIWILSGYLVSAVLLTVIYEPFGLWPLAWAAWVPFMLACSDRVCTWKLLLSAYGMGLLYWLWNLHWLYIVTLPGLIGFSFFFAGYWPVLAYGVRFARRKKWPLVLFAPLLLVGAEAVQGYLFTGFGWYYLAHSQYRQLPLIQMCDIFGVLGVSVLVAMINGVIVDWIVCLAHQRKGIGRLTSPRFSLPCVFSTLMCIVLIAGAVGYGHFRLAQTPAFITEGPLVGSVQPNVPAHVKEEMDNGSKILADLIGDGNACVQAGAKLVIWPETMVLAAMNAEYLAYCRPTSEPVQFHNRIAAFAEDRCYVLFGAHAVSFGNIDGRYDITDQYNSAFLYTPAGTQNLQRYDKIHLVPFGEYIPFKHSAPWLYRMILFLSPYDYDYNLTAGTEHTVFDVALEGHNYRFAVLICYEDTDPTVTRRHILDQNGNKICHWLVNISNDGWYVRFKDNFVDPMAELPQRTAISIFRCIENRTSIVRSVNTGISCLIDSTGAIRNDFRAGTLPEAAMNRQGVDGWFVDTIPIDSRTTFFSRYGRWLDFVLGAIFVIFLGFSIYGSRKYPPKTEG